MSKNQLTVDSLRGLLDTLSASGHGDMSVVLGKDTPLLEDAICFDYLTNKVLLRNTYYDKAMVDATNHLKDNLDNAVRHYLSECYDAGMNVKPDNETADKIRAAALSLKNVSKAVKNAADKMPDPLKKEIIGWRPIEEYDEDNKMNPGRYDWMLVTPYIHKNAIPVVAEKHKNRKWYDRYEQELLFTPRYFFDMEQLSKED